LKARLLPMKLSRQIPELDYPVVMIAGAAAVEFENAQRLIERQ
jgi:hypothetical protein